MKITNVNTVCLCIKFKFQVEQTRKVVCGRCGQEGHKKNSILCPKRKRGAHLNQPKPEPMEVGTADSVQDISETPVSSLPINVPTTIEMEDPEPIEIDLTGLETALPNAVLPVPLEPVPTVADPFVAEPAASSTALQCAVCRRNDTPGYPLRLAPMRGDFKERKFGARNLAALPIG